MYSPSVRTRSFRARTRFAGVATIAALLAFALPQIAHAANTVVRSNAMTGWVIDNQDLDTTHGAPVGRFTSGPDITPAGFGSFRQDARSGDKQALATILHNGDSLASLTSLSYSTFTTVTGPTILTSVLKLEVDKDGNGTRETTLVYEPYEQNQYGTGDPTAANVWQTWNAANGNWWSTLAADGGVSGPRKTLAAWNTDFGGSAAIAVVANGGIRIEAGSTGSSWPNFSGNFDNLVVGDDTYDFEPTLVHADAMNGWSFEHQDLNTGNAAPAADFVNGPAVPTSGYGSLRQTVLQGDKTAVITTNHNGLALSALDALSYSTYVTSSTTPVYPAAMKLAIDKDANGTADTTLVHEPLEQVGFGTGPAPAANVWQTWDALNGSWWSTAAGDGGNAGPRQTLAAWAAQWTGTPAIAQLTNAGVRIEAGATGTSWPDHVGSVDDVAIGIAGYDFETLNPDAPVITSPAQSAMLNSTTVAISGTSIPRGTVEISEGAAVLQAVTADASGSWSASQTFTAGSHSITTTAIDNEGNESASSAVRTFTIDLVAPSAPAIFSPAAGSTVNTSTVSFSGVAEPKATVNVKDGAVVIATGTASNSGSWSASASLPNAAYSVTATATDLAGNTGSSSAVRSFTVDTNQPTAPVITSPGLNAAVKTATVDIKGTAQPGVTVTVSEALTPLGTAVAGGTGAWTVSVPLSDGSHTVTAVANNGTADSPVSAERTFTVDTVAPSAPVIETPTEGAKLTAARVTISGTAEPNARIFVTEGPGQVGNTLTTAAGTWSLQATLREGAHTLSVLARDAATNESASVTRSFTVDTVKPTVRFTTANRALFAPGTPVEVAGTASDVGGVTGVEVSFRDAITGELVQSLEATVTQSGASYSWTATPEALPLGSYNVRATVTDTHGNTGTATISIVTLN